MCDTCDAAEFLDMLQSELAAHDFGTRGNEFLLSVAGWVEENEHVTERQKEAAQKWIDNKGVPSGRGRGR